METAALEARLAAAEAALATAQRERQAERTGRIRAEKALREARAAAEASGAAGGAAPARDVFPLVPIGTLQSVFSQRNGTPRQPLLAPSARSRLVLAPHVPAAALEGLEEFSHVWVLYVFHANTNLGERLGEAARASTCTAKVHVPRLDGARRGVLATRSPHRPTPLGLSVAAVRAVRGRVLELDGLDCVDGSPVLDVKPYLPFCDAPTGATAPDWAQAEVPGGAEPLAVAAVAFAPAAAAALAAAWALARREGGPRCGMAPLYDSASGFEATVREVLARDFRSAHQRERAGPRSAAAAAAPGDATSAAADAAASPPLRGRWRVVLDGVNIGYELDGAGRVTVTDAEVASLAQPEEEEDFGNGADTAGQ